jgi:hypothetical protein
MVIYQKGEEEDIDILEKPNIDLARAINDTLTDGLVFKTRSDKLMYLFQQQKEAWNSEINLAGLFSWLKNPFQFGNTFIIIILVLAVIYLYFRMNTIGGSTRFASTSCPSGSSTDSKLKAATRKSFQT